MQDCKEYNGDRALESRVRVLEAVGQERKEVMLLTAENLKERLSHLNELRGNVLTKAEYAVSHKSLEDKMAVLASDIAKVERFQSKLIGIGVLFVAVSFLLGLFLQHLIKP